MAAESTEDHQQRCAFRHQLWNWLDISMDATKFGAKLALAFILAGLCTYSSVLGIKMLITDKLINDTVAISITAISCFTPLLIGIPLWVAFYYLIEKTCQVFSDCLESQQQPQQITLLPH